MTGPPQGCVLSQLLFTLLTHESLQQLEMRPTAGAKWAAWLCDAETTIFLWMWRRRKRLSWTSGEYTSNILLWSSTVLLLRRGAAPTSWVLCTSQRTPPGLPTQHHWQGRFNSTSASFANWGKLEPQPPSCAHSTEAPLIPSAFRMTPPTHHTGKARTSRLKENFIYQADKKLISLPALPPLPVLLTALTLTQDSGLREQYWCALTKAGSQSVCLQFHRQ